MARIVETDNFNRDYPNEKFVNIPSVSMERAQRIADDINEALCNYDNAPRFWKVVDDMYKPQEGFTS